MIDAAVYIRDTGFFVEIAKALVGQFREVYYSMPTESGYMRATNDAVGTGIPGVTRIPSNSFWRYARNSKPGDLFYYPDCVFADEQEELRAQGKLVWGTAGTSWMEQDRFKLREWLEKRNMPIPPTDEYVGVDDLKENVKPEQYIKISKYRADMETVKNYDRTRSDQRFNELKVKFGILKDEMPFLVEDKIDGIELGYDGWNVDGDYPLFALWGIEVKDAGYLGKISRNDAMPDAIKYINGKIAEIFKDEQMRGPFSSEIRVDKQKRYHFTDATLREPNPPFQLKISMFSNYGECIHEGAKGNLVVPRPKARYGAIAIINSEFGVDNPVAVKIPKASRNNVKLLCLAERKGEAYALPIYRLPEIGAVIGMGDTAEAAIADCKKHAEGVKGDLVEIDVDALDKVLDEFKKGRSYGITF